MAVPEQSLHGKRVGVVGAGAAGLITAHVLSRDGFDVQVITRDQSPGGVWAKERIYPGLQINNVHGEFRFSPLVMPPPAKASESGGRLTGDDMRAYMEKFADTFVRDKIQFNTEVLKLSRPSDHGWVVRTKDIRDGSESELAFDRLVLCSGGCSRPNIPKDFSTAAVKNANYRGMVIHSSQFKSRLDDILEMTRPFPDQDQASIVIIGGGKSAQDIAAYLANGGRKVTTVFEKADAVLAVPTPLPDFIRRSRLLGILSPHIELRTRLERFLHTTWLGSKIVHFIWDKISQTSLDALRLPKNSPLRNIHSLFWGIRTNDEGVYRPNSFHSLVNAGQIHVIAPARAKCFAQDGKSILLSDGRSISADILILATGYASSWTSLFDESTAEEIGINRHPPSMEVKDTWSYTSLAYPPPGHSEREQWVSSIYRGLVPANNLHKRDFAINGAVFTTNNGYVYEVSAHWISSYFLEDNMRLPNSPEEAMMLAERNSVWLRKRFPDMLLWVNESYSSNLAFWDWPQAADELLEDMHLPSLRSGGNWFTWPFKVISLDEIANLGQERQEKRRSVPYS